MKAISTFIIENIKVTNDKPVVCTVQEFLVWYYFDNTETIGNLSFDVFFEVDFDPEVVEKHFNNNERKLYNFLMDHLDDEIELYKVKEDGYRYYNFFIDNISFMVEYCCGEFEKY